MLFTTIKLGLDLCSRWILYRSKIKEGTALAFAFGVSSWYEVVGHFHS